jgi:hypothetical protein
MENELLAADGSVYKQQGAYLIVDGGYHKASHRTLCSATFIASIVHDDVYGPLHECVSCHRDGVQWECFYGALALV